PARRRGARGLRTGRRPGSPRHTSISWRSPPSPPYEPAGTIVSDKLGIHTVWEERMRTAEVVICGAGIAGISAAYHLTVRHGLKNVVLVDDQPPLSVTSDKSTECYRNWWPGPGDTMVRFMNRGIDLLEELAAESGNVFVMNRRGYAYFHAGPAQAAELERGAREVSAMGAGELRIHRAGRGERGKQPAPRYPKEQA